MDHKGKSLESIVAYKGALPVERQLWNTDQGKRSVEHHTLQPEIINKI